MTVGRRDFLRRGAVLLVAAGSVRPLPGQQEEILPGQGETGSLRDPVSAGRSQERVTSRDNAEFVKAVEHRIQCTCGCTLDVYTCRTTDFTCTYSPAMHKEVLALEDEGKTADEIVAAFVAKYGEKVLMAPKPVGFNLAGYLLPGLLILLVAGIMVTLLRRRMAPAPATSAAPKMPAGALAGVGSAPDATPEELERLRRELQALDGEGS